MTTTSCCGTPLITSCTTRSCAAPADRVLTGTESVHVVIFNEGEENEGVYQVDRPPETDLLAFESAEDAERFATLLHAEELNEIGTLGKSVEWDAGKVLDFCELS